MIDAGGVSPLYQLGKAQFSRTPPEMDLQPSSTVLAVKKAAAKEWSGEKPIMMRLTRLIGVQGEDSMADQRTPR